MTASSTDTSIVDRIGSKIVPVLAGKLMPVIFLTIIMVLYSRNLSYADYGHFQSTWIYTNVLGVFAGFGVSSILLSSNLPVFIKFIKTHPLLLSLGYGMGFCICALIFYFSAGAFPSSTKLLLLAFVLVQVGCAIGDSLLIKQNLLNFYCLVNIVYACLFFIIHLYFYYNPFVLDQLIAAITGLAIVKAILLFIFQKRAATITAATRTTTAIGRNWLFIGLNEITGVLARWLDKLFLLYLLSPAEFAVFFNGAIEIPLFGILISAMEYILLTSIAADVSDADHTKKVFRESFKMLSLVVFPMFFFLLSAHQEAFAVIFQDKYNASIPVFLVSLCIMPVRITHYGVILQCYGRANIITIGAIADIAVAIILMLVLYPWLGTPGVALAVVLATYLQAAFYVWQSARVVSVTIGELVPVGFLLVWFLSSGVVFTVFYFASRGLANEMVLATGAGLTAVLIIGGGYFYRRKALAKPATLL